jgi:hypothetical protein
VTKKIFTFTFLLIHCCNCIHAQTTTVNNFSKKFDIIYQADVKYANNSLWLKKIRDDWQATGINLRIYKSSVNYNSDEINWNSSSYQIDNALRKIADSGLDIYIRINLTILAKDNNEMNYSDDDFHIRSNGQRFINPYTLKPLLNVTSLRSRGDMLNFIQAFVNHLKTLPSSVRSKIRLIVPTLTPDDETEYPFNSYNFDSKKIDHNILTGFSNPEISAFIQFIQKKYITIEKLNLEWGDGSDFSGFTSDQIQIKKYNWDGIKSETASKDYYKYENGRRDFLDFRREELKMFIDDCSNIVRSSDFRFGVQFGSIYDGLVEFRGFYDPTPLIENVDQLITGEILEYYPNFYFSADYSRSLCKYWTWEKNTTQSIIFSTESNWPGYADHSPISLIKYWSAQLRIFYEKGASSLFISHWGTTDSPNLVPDKVIDNSLLLDYGAWKDTLMKFNHSEVKSVSNDFSFHLAPEQGLTFSDYKKFKIYQVPTFTHNNGIEMGSTVKSKLFEFPMITLLKFETGLANQNNYKNNGDIITTYMMKNSPDYIKSNYKYFYWTASSIFMDRISTLK